MQVVPGVDRVSSGVANFYLVGSSDGIVLVDAGVSADWKLLGRSLAALGRSPSDLEAILLTHAHADHTGFAERARAEAQVPIWTHEADGAAAKSGSPGRSETGFGRYLRYAEAWRTLFGLLFHGGVRIVPILEVSTFAEGQTLQVPGRPTVVHVPGHTLGMSAIHFPEHGAVFTGDSLVTRNPLTGRRGPQIMPRALNVDSRRALDSLARLESLPVRFVLPGHGDPWTEGAADAVRRARVAGVS